MHRIRRNGTPRRSAGVTLMEMVLVIAIVGVLVGATLFFAYPVRQAVDVTVRAELTDVADNALQRIGREVRLALPNSVRVTNAGSVYYVEFIPLRTAARYRAESSGAACGSDTDDLAFDTADACFKSIGTIPNDTDVVPGDYLVLNNYGPGFDGQNAYQVSGTLNRRSITSVSGANTVAYTSTTSWDRKLHESPGRRFFIATTPVSYVCNPSAGTITRYAGYGFNLAQPTTFTSGTSALLANNVSACVFDYSPNVAPQIGLLTLRLSLAKTVSTGTESVALYHAIHVNNVP